MKILRQLDKPAKRIIGLGSVLVITALLGQSVPALARNSKEAEAVPPPTKESGELSQWPDLPIPGIPVPVPGLPQPEDILERGIEAILESFLKEEPPISTSLEDALTEVPFLDDFNPEIIAPLTVLPRGPQGGFLLRPGLYKLNAESYCLHAGKHGPNRGDGYLYTPLKGSRAGAIRNILQRSVERPEIPQQDIQVLLWAILSRTKISDLSPNVQAAAGKLLTPEEIFELNGGAWGLISDSQLRQVIDRLNLPPAMQQVLAAETRLRSLLSGGGSSYEELERIAVLFGNAPRGEGSREVPQGRWSYHPKGYFIRYFPNGYSLTRIEVSVPEPMQIERDQLRRITRIADRNGNSIETDYDDSIPPLTVAGNPAMKGYVFRSIRFVRRLAIPPEVVLDLKTQWNNLGWTLVGVSTGEGRVESPASRFVDAAVRYQWAKAHQEQIAKLDRHFQPQGNLADAVNLGNYATALKQVIQNAPAPQKEWVTSQLDLVKQAWQLAICQREGGCRGERALSAPLQYVAARFPFPFPSLLTSNTPDGSKGNGAEIEGGIATPGNTAQQRLAQSNRPNSEAEKADDCKRIREDMLDEEIWYKAFSDQNLVNEAEDLESYKRKVDDLALKIKGAKQGSQTVPSAITIMEARSGEGIWADLNGEWVNIVKKDGSKTREYSDVRDSYTSKHGNSAGEILFDAHVAHEMEHLEQYNSLGDQGTIQEFSQREVDAYEAGIEKKREGLKKLGCN